MEELIAVSGGVCEYLTMHGASVPFIGGCSRRFGHLGFWKCMGNFDGSHAELQVGQRAHAVLVQLARVKWRGCTPGLEHLTEGAKGTCLGKSS
jgi:hypothetical protein